MFCLHPFFDRKLQVPLVISSCLLLVVFCLLCFCACLVGCLDGWVVGWLDVLEFNICTLHNMTKWCCLAQLGPLSCIPTYGENSARPTLLDSTLGSTLNFTW